MKPLINWEELRTLTRPIHFSHMTREEQLTLWESEAECYDRIIQMELQGTLNALQCIPIQPDDTVLDVGCGPGRITSQLVKRAKKVTALDSSQAMMEKCKEKITHYSNIETVLMDWNDTQPDVTIPKHDIVIASRSVGSQDLKKLISFAKKYAVIIGWANAPSIPEVRSALFDSARKSEAPVRDIPFNHDRRFQYNIMYNLVYDLGYEPNINIVKDGFEGIYSSKEEAYSHLIHLTKNPDELDLEIFKTNVDRYLTKNENCYRFFCETRTFVLWWETNQKHFFGM